MVDTKSKSVFKEKIPTYQPLSRPLFIYVNNTSVRHTEVVEFVNFYIDNAAELSKDIGYIPLPSEKYTEQKKKLLFPNALIAITIGIILVISHPAKLVISFDISIKNRNFLFRSPFLFLRE